MDRMQRMSWCLTVLGLFAPAAELPAQPSRRPYARLAHEQVASPHTPHPSHLPLHSQDVHPSDILRRWAEIQKAVQAGEDKTRQEFQNALTRPGDRKSLEMLLRLQEKMKNGQFKLGPNDPLTQEVEKLLRKVRDDETASALLSPEQRGQVDEILKHLKEGGTLTPTTPSGPDPDPTGQGPTSRPDVPPPPPANGAGAASAALDPEELEARTRFENWLREQMGRLNDLEGPLADSPAVQRAIQDISRYVSRADFRKLGSPGRPTGFEEQLARIGRDLRPDRIWAEMNLPRLPRVDLPSINRAQLPSLGLPIGSLPSFNLPSIGPAPVTPGSEAGAGLFWVLGLAATGGALWLAFRYYGLLGLGRSNRDTDSRAWPVLPESVTTRDDLVRAFEHLSLLRFGEPARSWNHLDIAGRLGSAGADRRQAADLLASLYERARYAPGDEPLAAHALPGARRALTVLAAPEPA